LTDFVATKARFRLPKGLIYLDGNSLGPLPEGAMQRAQRTIEREWGEMLIRAWNLGGCNGPGLAHKPRPALVTFSPFHFFTVFRSHTTKGVQKMNAFANIWNHPRTTAAGLLIGVASVGSVLSQQGITLGKAGTGNVVSLATGIATVLLGLMAKDPSSQPGETQSAK